MENILGIVSKWEREWSHQSLFHKALKKVVQIIIECDISNFLQTAALKTCCMLSLGHLDLGTKRLCSRKLSIRYPLTPSIISMNSLSGRTRSASRFSTESKPSTTFFFATGILHARSNQWTSQNSYPKALTIASLILWAVATRSSNKPQENISL